MTTMRLRQAQAIIETARALDQVGFEMHPTDHDQHNLYMRPDDDYLTGRAEFNDPDNPRFNTRTYNLDIQPGPGDFDITVRLKFSYDPNGPVLLDKVFPVYQPKDDGESYPFGADTGPMLAELIATTVREYEKPYEAAYAARAGNGSAS
jgi:hypothetical protein